MRKLILTPDPILTQVSSGAIGCNLPEGLIADMQRIMREHKGLGISAPQVGENIRVIIVEDTVMLNPRWEPRINSGITLMLESCLSIPDVVVQCQRYKSITVEWIGLNGTRLTQCVDGIRSIIVQHEVDHLGGILITDRRT